VTNFDYSVRLGFMSAAQCFPPGRRKRTRGSTLGASAPFALQRISRSTSWPQSEASKQVRPMNRIRMRCHISPIPWTMLRLYGVKERLTTVKDSKRTHISKRKESSEMV
jgi:hypothetical protein